MMSSSRLISCRQSLLPLLEPVWKREFVHAADGHRAADEGRDTEQLAGPSVADGERAAIRGGQQDANEAGDDEEAARVALLAIDRTAGRQLDWEGVSQDLCA